MIKLTDLNYAYRKGQPILNNFGIELHAGNIYGLLGRNGAGKTTFLRLIAGLLFPHSGDCQVFGFTPSERRPDFLNELFFIAEEPHIPAVSIATFQKMYAPFYPRFDAERFTSLLQDFDIPENGSMRNLSYGQQKKVLFSFGIATNCRLLILDEPTNGIDIPSKSRFRSLLASNISDERIFIISTHQVRDMANLIDPIIILEAGQVLFQQDLMSISERLHFEFIPTMNAPTDAIYAERVPGGHIVVTENVSGQETEIDLEVLFNTVTQQATTIKQIFSNRRTVNR